MTKLTREQSAVIGAYTGVLCGPMEAVQEYCEKLLDRPIMTHEFPILQDQIKLAAEQDFLSLCCED